MRLNKWILDDTNEVDFEDAEAVNQTDGELNDTIITYEGNTSDVQSWTDFIGSFINGMKVGKFFKNLYAGIQYVLHVGSLVNNCVTDNSDLPLSAAQGKVLMDELTQIKSDLSELAVYSVTLPNMAWNGNYGTYTFDISGLGQIIATIPVVEYAGASRICVMQRTGLSSSMTSIDVQAWIPSDVSTTPAYGTFRLYVFYKS